MSGMLAALSAMINQRSSGQLAGQSLASPSPVHAQYQAHQPFSRPADYPQDGTQPARRRHLTVKAVRPEDLDPSAVAAANATASHFFAAPPPQPDVSASGGFIRPGEEHLYSAHRPTSMRPAVASTNASKRGAGLTDEFDSFRSHASLAKPQLSSDKTEQASKMPPRKRLMREDDLQARSRSRSHSNGPSRSRSQSASEVDLPVSEDAPHVTSPTSEDLPEARVTKLQRSSSRDKMLQTATVPAQNGRLKHLSPQPVGSSDLQRNLLSGDQMRRPAVAASSPDSGLPSISNPPIRRPQVAHRKIIDDDSSPLQPIANAHTSAVQRQHSSPTQPVRDQQQFSMQPQQAQMHRQQLQQQEHQRQMAMRQQSNVPLVNYAPPYAQQNPQAQLSQYHYSPQLGQYGATQHQLGQPSIPIHVHPHMSSAMYQQPGGYINPLGRSGAAYYSPPADGRIAGFRPPPPIPTVNTMVRKHAVPSPARPRQNGHPSPQNLHSNGHQPQSMAQRSSPQQPAPKRKLVKRQIESESEEDEFEEGDSDARADSEEGVDAAEVLQFFNDSPSELLADVISIKPAALKILLSLRPFESTQDILAKLKATKGVSTKIYENYADLANSYVAVDKIFKKCETIGDQVSKTMRIWRGADSARPKTYLSSVAASSGTSRASTPDTDSGATQLTTFNEEAYLQSTQASARADVKAAFDGYMREQPKSLSKDVQLKSYQILGVNWLNLLYKKKTSCILADEMGLGKTAQIIALLAHLQDIGSPGPHLIIVPSSTLENWSREFARFAPELNVATYYGTLAERAVQRAEYREAKDLDVVITTYQTSTSGPDDRKFLRKMRFETCTYDEGHQLKNSMSKKYKELMDIHVNWRCLLTGTPLQNNLQELLSLLAFILPDIFLDKSEAFKAIFKLPADAQQGLLSQGLLSQKRIEAAKRVMTPFVLRRKKLQVLTDLPKKIEIVEYCDMTSLQKEVYRETLRRSKKSMRAADAKLLGTQAGAAPAAPVETQKTVKTTPKRIGGPSDASSNIIMDLRKAANHPMLFRRLYTDKKIRAMARDCLREVEFHDRSEALIVEDMEIMTDFELHRFCEPYKHLQKYRLGDTQWMEAGKVKKLQQLLPGLKAKGHRVLLFSQFTQVLDIIESIMDTMDMRYLKLTGQTSVVERQGMVDDFTNDPEITVFLLSTRAGGLGLNLVAANTIILWDQDFNPHNDKQAEDRAYRIGQTSDVTVYRFITKQTIEEDMHSLGQTKLALDQEISKSDDTRDTSKVSLAASLAGEGNEELVEKRMKATLLSKIVDRMSESDDEDAVGENEGDDDYTQ
ncbi:uncharacterized protein L969DRAFT_49347 [Mixia osmundae IAM 14324]|uniref:DNA helicase n=1 Tax=Mixia osmundae (strain CBS 9802 / IAM 14324 / JCM 22182 / KY 12970) TaxID=764103 RepID=G7E3I6_MIXOS|nr:uncharacterized protein L969DRAFT_49347 [Mixia osmundae IAM 14324]KEI39382.1 hypothetical protein L969DRAFT_49347 [Mixia osmundae IAM 14324]GAA97396.1 hypothetical protein E5Q_04074 [Mixia osmundae IAM 14324]